MDLLFEYSLFLLKLITYLILTFVFIISISYFLKKNIKKKYKLKIKNISNFYNNIINISFKNKIQFNKKKFIKNSKWDYKKPILYVLNFYGDVHASEISHLKKEISIIISIIQPNDEVLLKLESFGGTVHEYGLAASQLQRLRNHNIKLTVVIDKIAASGGYMMACVANYIYAAPFAIIGSIGVIGQIPNFNRFLKKNNIDVEIHTAGHYKRNLTMFGENNNNHRLNFQKKLNITHKLFKDFIFKMRPSLDIEKVSNGDYWFGMIALKKKLIDDINTSEDVILKNMKKFNIISIKYIKSKNIFKNFIFNFLKKIFTILY